MLTVAEKSANYRARMSPEQRTARYRRNLPKVQKWRNEHPDEWRQAQLEGFTAWYERDPLHYKFLQAKRSKKAKELGFTITEADLLVDGVLPKFCPYLGIELNYSYRGGDGGRHDDAPSIDRIDSSKGYHPGNVVVCSWLANKIKGHGSLEQLRSVVKGMEQLLCNGVATGKPPQT